MSYQFLLTPFFLDKEKPELKRIQEKNWQLNQPVVTGKTVHSRIKEVHNATRAQVESILQQGKIPVSMGGDCCMPIPIMATLQRSGISPIILWLDAHGDFNTDETTQSGFLGGMPLAMLSGRGDMQFIENAGVNTIPGTDIVLTDARDLDPAEKELIESSHIHWLKNIRDVKRFNFKNRPIYIHFDVDVMNTLDVPATLYPVENGPRVAEMADLFRYLRQTQNICAISVTCWEPLLDKDNKTGDACKALLVTLLQP
jgi:arginase